MTSFAFKNSIYSLQEKKYQEISVDFSEKEGLLEEGNIEREN